MTCVCLPLTVLMKLHDTDVMVSGTGQQLLIGQSYKQSVRHAHSNCANVVCVAGVWCVYDNKPWSCTGAGEDCTGIRPQRTRVIVLAWKCPCLSVDLRVDVKRVWDRWGAPLWKVVCVVFICSCTVRPSASTGVFSLSLLHNMPWERAL